VYFGALLLIQIVELTWSYVFVSSIVCIKSRYRRYL